MPQVAALLAASGSSEPSGSSGRSGSGGDAGSAARSSGSAAGGSEQQQRQLQRRRKLALVFGREVEGLNAAEVAACDYTLSIPIGRLQGGRGVS